MQLRFYSCSITTTPNKKKKTRTANDSKKKRKMLIEKKQRKVTGKSIYLSSLEPLETNKARRGFKSQKLWLSNKATIL